MVQSLEEGGSPEPLLATEFNERNSEISPDGRWLAYQSDASGQEEIYVRPFPNVELGRWQVSRDGGTRPLWAPDGSELFYLTSAGQLMSVRVQTEPSFTPGNAVLVFEGDYFGAASSQPFAPTGRTYDISPDGQRFLMLIYLMLKRGASDETSTTELILVQNWFEELNRLVPTEN